MTINEYLCKNYDTNHKGYVTLGDMGETIGWLTALFITSYTYFFGAYRYIYNGFQIPYTTTLLNDLTSFVFVVGSAFLIVIIFCLFILAASEIRIAKCKLKDKTE